VSIHAGPRTMDLRTFPKRPLFQIVTLTLRSWFGPGSAHARRVPHWAMVNAAKPADIAGFPRVGRYWGLLAARN
jgi:hypothetical protein